MFVVFTIVVGSPEEFTSYIGGCVCLCLNYSLTYYLDPESHFHITQSINPFVFILLSEQESLVTQCLEITFGAWVSFESVFFLNVNLIFKLSLRKFEYMVKTKKNTKLFCITELVDPCTNLGYIIYRKTTVRPS